MPPKPRPDTFASRLRELREAAGLSVSQLATRAALTRQGIRLLERGEREPSLETARKIAEALGSDLACWN